MFAAKPKLQNSGNCTPLPPQSSRNKTGQQNPSIRVSVYAVIVIETIIDNISTGASAFGPQVWIYGNNLIRCCCVCSKNASYIRCCVSNSKLKHWQAWADAIISNTMCTENPMWFNREICSWKPQLITCFFHVGLHDRLADARYTVDLIFHATSN